MRAETNVGSEQTSALPANGQRGSAAARPAVFDCTSSRRDSRSSFTVLSFLPFFSALCTRSPPPLPAPRLRVAPRPSPCPREPCPIEQEQPKPLYSIGPPGLDRVIRTDGLRVDGRSALRCLLRRERTGGAGCQARAGEREESPFEARGGEGGPNRRRTELEEEPPSSPQRFSSLPPSAVCYGQAAIPPAVSGWGGGASLFIPPHLLLDHILRDIPDSLSPASLNSNEPVLTCSPPRQNCVPCPHSRLRRSTYPFPQHELSTQPPPMGRQNPLGALRPGGPLCRTAVRCSPSVDSGTRT